MRKMTLALLAGSLLAVPVIAAAHPDGDDDKRDKRQITETFDFEDFDAIAVSGVYELDVKVGGNYSITLKGAADEMDNVEVKQEGRELSLGSKRKWRKGNRDGITATITLPDLRDVQVSGVASGDFTGIDADDFELHVSGVAEVDIDGKCNSLEAHVSGVGELDASELKCKNADVHLSGVGEVAVYASDYADISASGVGEVDVYGNPEKVDKSKSLFTEINIK